MNPIKSVLQNIFSILSYISIKISIGFGMGLLNTISQFINHLPIQLAINEANPGDGIICDLFNILKK